MSMKCGVLVMWLLWLLILFVYYVLSSIVLMFVF